MRRNMEKEKIKFHNETITTSAEYPRGTYTIILQRTILGQNQYVDYGKVVRVGK